MKYKVGDKVRVRSDLVLCNRAYGGLSFTTTMSEFKGKTVTIKLVLGNKYRLVEDTGKFAWSDEMFEDVEEEFKLPEKWCIKLSTKEINDAVNSIELWREDQLSWDNTDSYTDHYIGFDGNYSKLLVSDGYTEITFDQFKKYVMKSESTPVKENKIVWLNGRWYRILNNWWGKFETIHNSGKRIKFSESITASGKYEATPKNIDLISEVELLTDLSEIQQYLPENHPDKLKKRTKKVEDLKYPDAVHCSSKEQHDKVKQFANIRDYEGNYYYLIGAGGRREKPWDGTCGSNPESRTTYTNYEFSAIIFPEEKVVDKEDEEFKVGAYIVFIDSFGGSAKGDIDKIKLVLRPEHIQLEKEGLCLSRLGEGFDKKCKYFLTLKEAQAFSDELLGKNKVETKPKLSKEELLAEAKRRYPVGTKYKTASNDSSDIFVLSSNNWGDNLLDDVVHAEYGKGCLYYKGDWAEIISKPTVEEEVIDVPEYIECIEGFSDYIIPGLIYKVIDKTHVDSMILRCNITSNLSAGSNLYVSVWSFAFKPSTKEAFEKQSKSSVKEKEELVQTGLSQSQACDSCKYCGEECAKRKGCDATGGQHYPKDDLSERYIVAVDPFDSESYSDGTEVGKFLSNKGMGFYEQMEKMCMQTYSSMGLISGLYYIPAVPKDCFESDEIYVPIIKTEVKQIKL